MDHLLELQLSLGRFLVEVKQAIIEELKQQGHVASGKLIDTIELEITRPGISIIAGKILMQDYALPLNTGFKPKFSRGSGAGTSKYINALIEWLGIKGIGTDQKERKGIAFAIATKAAQTGHPTPGSYVYASNNRRKEFTKYAVEPLLTNISEKMGLQEVFMAIFEDAVKSAL